MHATRDTSRLGRQSNAPKDRFGTFLCIVHEPPDRSSLLNNFPRTFRNPRCNRSFARTAEGADGTLLILKHGRVDQLWTVKYGADVPRRSRVHITARRAQKIIHHEFWLHLDHAGNQYAHEPRGNHEQRVLLKRKVLPIRPFTFFPVVRARTYASKSSGYDASRTSNLEQMRPSKVGTSFSPRELFCHPCFMFHRTSHCTVRICHNAKKRSLRVCVTDTASCNLREKQVKWMRRSVSWLDVQVAPAGKGWMKRPNTNLRGYV